MANSYYIDEGDELEKYVINELKVVNKYIPMRRKLSELIKERYPYVLCSDGGIHMFRVEEINELIRSVGVEAYDLYLPIVVEVKIDLNTTTAVVRDPHAAKLLSKLLGIPYNEGPLYLYPLHLGELRRRIGTLIYYLITM